MYLKNRKITINSIFSFLNFYLYNGKSYYKLAIDSKMNNYKLGEFSITKKKCVFKSKKKKKQPSKKQSKKKRK